MLSVAVLFGSVEFSTLHQAQLLDALLLRWRVVLVRLSEDSLSTFLVRCSFLHETLSPQIIVLISTLKTLEGTKIALSLAIILIAAPVRGFLPLSAFVRMTLNMPNFSSFTVRSNRSSFLIAPNNASMAYPL